MGITGFWSYYGHLIKKVPINQLSGKIAFIDIVLYIHKYVIGIRKTGKDILSKDGKIINHIYAISKIIKNYIDDGILPICIFDGKSPLLKEETIEKRKETSEEAKRKCDEMINNSTIDISREEYIKHFKRSFMINNDMITDCKRFLEYCGLPYVNSIGEADPQCAAFAHYYQNISCGVFSEDSDILLYGAPLLLRDYDLKTNTVSIISIDDILNFLQEKTDIITQKYNKPQITITKDNFINFSIIMGNDYCNGIRIAGGNNRDKLFELFVLSDFNIDVFVNILYDINVKKMSYYVPENFLIKSYMSKKIYKEGEIYNPSNIDISIKKYDANKISSFLKLNDFREDIITHLICSLDRIYNYYNNAIQINPINNDWVSVKKKTIRY